MLFLTKGLCCPFVKDEWRVQGNRRKGLVLSGFKYGNRVLMLWTLILRVGNKNNPCIRVTQENSIKIPLQTSLPYILLLMVHANYCAPYPKQPCVVHEVNIWYPCCMTLLVLEPFMTFSQVPWSMLWPHHQMWLMWSITSNPNPRVLKIENMKNKSKGK